MGSIMTQDSRNKRANTRSHVWPDVTATIKVEDPFSVGRKVLTVTGKVGDIGSTGFFLKTVETLPIPAKAEITIDFDPAHPDSKSTVKAFGEIVRGTPEGVGIRFTRIDLRFMQECIMNRMNRS